MLLNLKIEAGTITSVEHDQSPGLTIPNGRSFTDLPPRTIVKLSLSPEAGSMIRVELWLPDAVNWNSRLLGLGSGGAAGSIDPGRLAGPLADGYAVAITDMGTAPNSDSGIGNPAVWKDFGYRATHLMTVAAKQVIQAFYKRDPEYSYFCGASTGGQQGMQEAQRYPEDYDGIVAAIPAHCRTPLHAYFLWNEQVFLQCPFTESQQISVIAAANESMAVREIPTVAGKFISDPRCDDAGIEAVIALAMEKDPTLTVAHAQALRKLFDGPRHLVTGARIFHGIPLGSSFQGAQGHLYLFRWVFGLDKNIEDIDFGSDFDTYSAALAPYLDADNVDLSAFAQRGSKLLMTLGTADSVVPYHGSLRYYERMIEHLGSISQVQSFFLFYMIPGMAHSGGPGINQLPNLVEKIRDWREDGIIPDVLQGRRIVQGTIEMEMPLYPYPLTTGWDEKTSSYIPVVGQRGLMGSE